MYLQYFKRILDITGVILVALACSWLFVLIILLYLITFQFPVFFVQRRVGKNNKPFYLIKFRTLKTSTGTLQQRRFWLGDFLRYTSLDELPQLWNILKGEMSFIGPRPLPVEYLPLFSEEQKKRHCVRPGITGWAQVNGRHSISWEEKFTLDLYYVSRVSFIFDLMIVWKTVILMLSLKEDQSLEEPPFKGNL